MSDKINAYNASNSSWVHLLLIPPEEIILSKKIKDLELIKTALEKKYNKKINIKTAKNNTENLRAFKC